MYYFYSFIFRCIIITYFPTFIEASIIYKYQFKIVESL